jgi:hypothetical protein
METLSQYGGFISATIVLAGAFWGSYKFAYKKGFDQGVEEFNNEAQRNRYNLIYAPLQALFLDIHLSSSQITNAPYFKIRLFFCWQQLKLKNFKRAFQKLWDRQEGKETAEIEHGGGFPFKKITEVLKNNEQYADNKLLKLIKSADRASYEDSFFGEIEPWEDSQLNDEEFELYKHIVKTHTKLNNIFVPESSNRKKEVK